MSEKVPHYLRVAKLIKKRILHGDYLIKPFPSERQLAPEFGVNYMTVRRGLQLLEKEGLLERQSNGRMRVNSDGSNPSKAARIALLVPMVASPQVEEWRASVEKAALSRGASVRTALFVHWDDPIIVDAAKGFEGVFVIPASEPLPKEVMKFLQDPAHRIVMLDQNYSGYGLPSIIQFPSTSLQKILDHLAALGKKQIACFNTQPEDDTVLERIDQWRYWMAAHEFQGKLYSRPVPSGMLAGVEAHRFMNELLQTRTLKADSLFCITMASAMGAIRALKDHGITAGRDIPVAAMNGEGIAELLNPSLTSLRSPDVIPYLRFCLDWMLSGEKWIGPLMMAPPEVPLFIGESTGGK